LPEEFQPQEKALKGLGGGSWIPPQLVAYSTGNYLFRHDRQEVQYPKIIENLVNPIEIAKKYIIPSNPSKIFDSWHEIFLNNPFNTTSTSIS